MIRTGTPLFASVKASTSPEGPDPTYVHEDQQVSDTNNGQNVRPKLKLALRREWACYTPKLQLVYYRRACWEVRNVDFSSLILFHLFHIESTVMQLVSQSEHREHFTALVLPPRISTAGTYVYLKYGSENSTIVEISIILI